MKTLIAAATLPFLMAPLAFAEGDVTPGLWSYEATTALGPIPMRDRGTHCVDQEMARASYESLLNDINPNCRVTSGGQESDGYHFTLRCTGGPDGELTGRLVTGASDANLSATGWTGTADSRVPVIISASATKLSPSCS
ncbi:DUF3617 family protein [Henriciella sp.]|uniref:DUF3617 domain-containing protein n=1 Tax=Henriciella sp. TaxID=1968823 RepID=UPI00260655BC|nr:DUF3617 family protein [Henriciella sp.]